VTTHRKSRHQDRAFEDAVVPYIAAAVVIGFIAMLVMKIVN